MRMVRVLGIDLGLRRIGLAVSDASGTLARPLRTIERGSSDRQAANALAEAVAGLSREEDGLGLIVIGRPTRLDGSSTDQTGHAEHMAEQLRRRVGVPIVLQDERLSSHEAEGRLASTERDWRVRKQKLDAAAAAVILQDYLDAHIDGPPTAVNPEE
jgi:putative Holliday junction resolvase